MSNRLEKETSPYLREHKDNPVDWYPWCPEAFEKAAKEDKPVFLSIGYSACHWCHVFARESFEDKEIASLLNNGFVSVKVDKEERPDIDSVYMSVCQAFTGSGGWPTSIFMTPDQKPFFAGTYFPKTSRRGMLGFRELLTVIHQKWHSDRALLLKQSNEIVQYLNQPEKNASNTQVDLFDLAVSQYTRMYDPKNGGFGEAPKFPAPHNLLFLLDYGHRYNHTACLHMAEHTLLQMYRGGIFDHIGFGFCRYSTDKLFLVPHFEKMLYDNALLILAYCKAYVITKNELYLEIAEKTAAYLLRETASPEGGFFSSQDADSDGEEGKYYLFTPREIEKTLGQKDGAAFCKHFNITEKGNFEEKSVPNLLNSDPYDKSFESFLSALNEYRKKRFPLRRDEKILTSWNSLAIAALCELYLVSKKANYLAAAKNADDFIQKYLYDGSALYVHFCLGKRGVKGFLDDYACYAFCQLSLYRATLEEHYLNRAKALCDKVLSDFNDKNGGFYLYGDGHEPLIFRPKETYDGAVPCGNSLIFYNLVRLSALTDETRYKSETEKLVSFLEQAALPFPANHAMFLNALLEHQSPCAKITVAADQTSNKSTLPLVFPSNATLVITQPTEKYPLKNGKTTYYVCRNGVCLPATNRLEEATLC